MAEGDDVFRIVAHEPVAPIADRMQNCEELLAGFVKVVLMPGWSLLIELPLHHACRLQRFQPGGQDVARRACVESDVVKAVLAKGDLPKCEKRPFLADHFQGDFNGTDSGVSNARGSHFGLLSPDWWIGNPNPLTWCPQRGPSVGWCFQSTFTKGWLR